jgi:hypothetical protein
MRSRESTPGIREHFEKAAAKSRKRKPRPQVARPFSIRLSEDERALLTCEAGKLSLGAHIRRKLLGDRVSRRNEKEPSRKRPNPKADQVALAKVLALLGRSELAHSLDAIARAAVMGALPLSSELIEELKSACAHVRAMRDALVEALGVKRDFDHDSGR